MSEEEEWLWSKGGCGGADASLSRLGQVSQGPRPLHHLEPLQVFVVGLDGPGATLGEGTGGGTAGRQVLGGRLG